MLPSMFLRAVGKEYPLFDENRTVPFFRPSHRTQEQNVPPFPTVGTHPYLPYPSRRGSLTVHYEIMHLPALTFCQAAAEVPGPLAPINPFLDPGPSHSRATRAIQPRRGLHGTCLAMATGEIPDRSFGLAVAIALAPKSNWESLSNVF